MAWWSSGGTVEQMKRNPLFVFGFFSRGMVHFRKIENHIEDERPATVRGAIYRLPSGMPVLGSEGTQTIAGWVVQLKSPDILMALLDEFHGVHRADPDKGLFLREEVQACLDEGGLEIADAYCINPLRLPRGAKSIEDADWRRSLEQQPPLLAKLTERQRSYILRLGASSGRDIVPIDLGLYRELMHLEIVADKGRRLALTSLGQELYRFLS